MLGSKLRNTATALGILLGTVMTGEQYAVIRLARRELVDAADEADDLEISLQVWTQNRPQAGKETPDA